jgi:hypothetical protein
MKDDKKTSIIKEALSDYNAILETAEANAKKKLVDEFPDKFNNLLKEEITKNKSKKESYKKLDESEESTEVDNTNTNNEEPVMKEQIKETNSVVNKGEPFTKGAKNVAKVSEDVKITDTRDDSTFTEKAKNTGIFEEREKSFIADKESDTPNFGNSADSNNGKRFDNKIVAPTSGKPMTNVSEELDMTGLDMNEINTALDEMDGSDEVITIDEIDDEISNMDNLSGELDNAGSGEEGMKGNENGEGGEDNDEGIEGMENIEGGEEGNEDSTVEKLKDMVEILQGLIGEFGGEESQEEPEEIAEIDRSALIQGITANLEGMSDEELEQLSQQVAPAVTDETSITEEDITNTLGDGNAPVDEAMGIAHSASKQVAGDHLPAPDFAQGRHKRLGSVNNTNENVSKKLGGLIDENKKLTKKLNESIKYKKSASTLIESYKNALEKYRSQLKEMAVFNTNLAHVNNILVNEELALTQEDKIKIINEFKQVNSITESQNKYKTILSEMKVGKKTITESFEKKVSTSIQPSSKQKLDEVVEKTAYANDAHINKMRKLINYVETRGKK